MLHLLKFCITKLQKRKLIRYWCLSSPHTYDCKFQTPLFSFCKSKRKIDFTPLHSLCDLSLHQQTLGCQNTKLTIITTPENAKICRTPREFKIQNKTDNRIVFTASRKAHKPSNASKPHLKQLILNALQPNKTIKLTTNKNTSEKLLRRFLL